MNKRLGTVETSEQLIQELYIELKRKVNDWAAVTHQTSQARMGYVGQHLVSVVTGYPGGRSGARGKDLVLPNGEFAEIKTCYRIDQLGRCNSCGSVVSSIESECPNCGSDNLKRNDDSKWLISVRHDDEFVKVLDDRYYFLVLFDFVDLRSPNAIRATIWRADTKTPGFAYCMIDYYLNIRANSKSKAPFNLWPYQLKFDLLRAELIYASVITDNSINTKIFPGRDSSTETKLKPLQEYARASNLTDDAVTRFAELLQLDMQNGKKKTTLLQLQNQIAAQDIPNRLVADTLAYAMYYPNIENLILGLPNRLQAQVQEITATILAAMESR
jgi:predicted RNA-binding Zn-ribbon protein involved in translation (DUF1610 family)